MIDRCNKDINYKGRGIKVCKRWSTFDNFKLDMYDSYIIHKNTYKNKFDTSLDRKDNDKGYFPGNCRWATAMEQRVNCRRIILVNYQGTNMPLKHLAHLLKIPYMRLYKRYVIHKWTLEKAITLPARANRNR